MKLPIIAYMVASRSNYLTAGSKIVVLDMCFIFESCRFGIVLADNEIPLAAFPS